MKFATKRTEPDFLVSLILFILCTRIVCGNDPDAILPNNRSPQNNVDKSKPSIQSHRLISAIRSCAKKYATNRAMKQLPMNNPYFLDYPDYTFHIIPKRGDSCHHKLRLYRAINSYKSNAQGIYDQKQKENIKAIFQSLAYETEEKTTQPDEKANMESVFGFSSPKLEKNKNSPMNTVDKGFIDNSTLMARIVEIFGPPPTAFKRNVDEKHYSGSLQAAIYKNFGPEVVETSNNSDKGDNNTSPMEVDNNPVDSSGLKDRFPPVEDIVTKFAKDHENKTTTQDPRPTQSGPDSRQISRSSGNRGFPSPKMQEVPILRSTSSSSIPSSSFPPPSIPPTSKPSLITTVSPNGARVHKTNLMLHQSCLLVILCMMTLVASL